MSLTEIMAVVGVAVQGTLTLLLLVAWRALRARWTLLLSAGFLSITLQYVAVACGHFGAGDGMDAPPAAFNASAGLLAHALITWSLVDYVGVPARAARRMRAATLLVLALALAALAFGVLTRGETVAVIAAFMVSWSVLFFRAMRREPRSGHGIVMLAALIYPTLTVAALEGRFSVIGAGISLIVPHAVLGMTLLTTGLIRAQATSRRELAARREAQAELERINQTLEQRVEQRTAQQQETIAGLESFNRSVSHDLRGPLGGITGVAQLARDALARGDLVDADRLLAAIGRQSQSSTDLVTSLLALARSGEGSVERRSVDTGVLAQEVADLLAGAASPVIHVSSPMPRLQADPALLRQVFVNLLANGVKFSGGAAAPSVEVGATRSLQGIVFHVRDNGVGFSEDQRRELFVPFRRLHADRFEGNGIGLTIVRRIVERHGGRLWAEGRPGQGATFYFTLEEERAAA